MILFRTQFIEDVRKVMGVPDWMLTIDTRRTKHLHNDGCVQLFLHFKGPKVYQIFYNSNFIITLIKLIYFIG